MGKLTARKVATATAGKYDDGEGLRLYVSPTGGRKWVLRITIRGKRRELGIGSVRDVTLAQARLIAAQWGALARQGIDPRANRKAAVVPTFTQVAAMYLRAHRRGWSNPKHARQWPATLKTYVRPIIGERPVNEVTTEDVLRILAPIWHQKTETAKRVQGRIENILDFAAARKWRGSDNPARWRGHLDKLLPRPSKVATVTHHPAMDYSDVPAFMDELRDMPSLSSLALQWLILSATRTGETLGARWDEIDQQVDVWTVPADRMKAGRDHRVPLTPPMLAILKQLPRMVGNPHLFPGARHGRALSKMALLQLMRGLGYGPGGERGHAVPHGFRSAFRDWSAEVASAPREIAEAALAHTLESKVEAAYQRSDLLLKRRRLMEQWGAWCTRTRAAVARMPAVKAC